MNRTTLIALGLGASVVLASTAAVVALMPRVEAAPAESNLVVEREAATAALLAGSPVLAFDAPGFRPRVAAAVASIAELSEADRQGVTEAVVALTTARFGVAAEMYAVQRLAAGQPLPSVAFMMDELGADILWTSIGRTDPVADQTPAQVVTAVFASLDQFGGGVNRALGVVDLPSCFAAVDGQWGSLVPTIGELGGEHWHGARLIKGRQWFSTPTAPADGSRRITVSMFFAFADGSKSPIHFHVARDAGGAWQVFEVNRNNVSSPFASIDF